jgi:hypothetical protein
MRCTISKCVQCDVIPIIPLYSINENVNIGNYYQFGNNREIIPEINLFYKNRLKWSICFRFKIKPFEEVIQFV